MAVKARDCESIQVRTKSKHSPRRTQRTRSFNIDFLRVLGNCSSLLNHRDVANAENAGAVFCLPPASMQSFVFSVVNNFFQPDLNNIFTVSHLDRLIIPKRDKFILPASFAGDTLRYKAYLAAGKIYALAPISALSIHIKLFQAIA
jgi:hypothetical protein